MSRNTAAPPAATPPPTRANTALPTSTPPRRKSFLPVKHLARDWPSGHPDEAPILLASLLIAIVQLASWVVELIGRLIFLIFQLGASLLASVARKLSGERLRGRGADILGWSLVIILLAGTLTGLGYTHRVTLTRWFQTTIPHRAIPYAPPPSTCSQPRLVCANPTELIDGQPSISATKILSVLQSFHSPTATADFANALYDLGVQYGINPAYALGFFAQESSCGTQGLAVNTLSLGNIRYTTSSSPVSYAAFQGFRQYHSWRDGAQDWYWVIRTYYLNQGVRDIFDVTPIYAPSTDNNDPARYAQNVYQFVLEWSGS